MGGNWVDRRQLREMAVVQVEPDWIEARLVEGGRWVNVAAEIRIYYLAPSANGGPTIWQVAVVLEPPNWQDLEAFKRTGDYKRALDRAIELLARKIEESVAPLGNP